MEYPLLNNFFELYTKLQEVTRYLKENLVFINKKHYYNYLLRIIILDSPHLN